MIDKEHNRIFATDFTINMAVDCVKVVALATN